MEDVIQLGFWIVVAIFCVAFLSIAGAEAEKKGLPGSPTLSKDYIIFNDQ
jgi:hypothetical protein